MNLWCCYCDCACIIFAFLVLTALAHIMFIVLSPVHLILKERVRKHKIICRVETGSNIYEGQCSGELCVLFVLNSPYGLCGQKRQH